MAFDRDSKSIFLNYYNSILAERMDPSTLDGQAAIAAAAAAAAKPQPKFRTATPNTPVVPTTPAANNIKTNVTSTSDPNTQLDGSNPAVSFFNNMGVQHDLPLAGYWSTSAPTAAQPTFNTMTNPMSVTPVQVSAPKAQPTASSTMQQAATNLSNSNTQQQVQQTSGKVQQQAQLDAFKKMHGTAFNPNSSMDRRKMAQMTGQASVSAAMPGGGNKPGQIKTAAPAAPTATSPGGSYNPKAQVQRAVPANLPPGYAERQNSKLPGVLGSVSNFLGRAGDTAKNVATGTAGQVNPGGSARFGYQSKTAAPKAPTTQTKTTAAPKAKPTNPKVR